MHQGCEGVIIRVLFVHRSYIKGEERGSMNYNEKMHENACKNTRKNLHISKKSCTFAAF